jgi:hypothetical protein
VKLPKSNRLKKTMLMEPPQKTKPNKTDGGIVLQKRRAIETAPSFAGEPTT